MWIQQQIEALTALRAACKSAAFIWRFCSGGECGEYINGPNGRERTLDALARMSRDIYETRAAVIASGIDVRAWPIVKLEIDSTLVDSAAGGRWILTGWNVDELKALGARCQVEIQHLRNSADESAEDSGTPIEGGAAAAEAAIIPRRAAIAGEQWKRGYAMIRESGESDDPGDSEVYAKLAKRPEELPAFQTWSRNLREYRRLTGQQKRKPRRGRADDARSIVRQTEK